MHLVDWIALAIVVLAALAGLRRGLILSAFSLVGLALGAYVGATVSPHLLSDGADPVWTPVAGLVGAVIGAGLLQIVAVIAGSYLRGGLRLTPLRVLDSAGGLLLGIVTGLAVIWVCALVVIRSPTHVGFRTDVQRSWIVQRIYAAVPPRDVLPLLRGAIDPFLFIVGPEVPTLPPSVGVLRNPRIRASLTRVVKVLGTPCGVGVEGSGWFARVDLVVTAAHVVAGEHDTVVEIPGDPVQHVATVVVFDVHNDIAVLRVSDVTVRPLRLVDPRDGASVAIVGYPLDGSLTATAGRVGPTANAYTYDALGRDKVLRAITAVGGRVRPGNSGGPVIDTRGNVEATIFAKPKHSRGGYAVPASIIRSDLASVGRRAVSTESCALP